MSEIEQLIEKVPVIPHPRNSGWSTSKSSRMVKTLTELPKGCCVTVFPVDQHDQIRMRTHWNNAATRAGMKITTRAVLLDDGRKVLRIWRISEDQ